MSWKFDSSAVKFDTNRATMDGYQRLLLAMSIIEPITVTDTEVLGCIRLRMVLDLLKIADQNTKLMQLCRSIVDAIMEGDLMAAKGRLFLAIIEAFAISDQNTVKLTRIVVQSLLEAFGLVDPETPATVRLYGPKLNEGIVTADQIPVSISKIRTVIESLTAVDISPHGLALVRGFIEALNVNDVETHSSLRYAAIQDAITLISRHTSIPIRQRLLIESILATDSKQWTPLKLRTLFEAILMIDSATAVYFPFIFAGINPATPIVIGGR